MGVLSRIANAEDRVPFSAAHEFKRDLDEAVGTGWDRAVRKRVTGITKGLRGELRQALAVHEPYNQATAAYEKAIKLYTEGIPPRLRKLALAKPESLVAGKESLLSPKEPTSATMLHW